METPSIFRQGKIMTDANPTAPQQQPPSHQAPSGNGLLTDDLGKKSMMRLMSLIALVASIWFGWITLTDANTSGNEGVYITTAFLLAAFAPKALQKFIENSYPPQNHK